MLLSHPLLGGFDMMTGFAETYIGAGTRFVAASQFGYLGSFLPPAAVPADQADAYALFLDALGIDRAAVFGYSGGGPSAIQFALRHAGRSTALVTDLAAAREFYHGKLGLQIIRGRICHRVPGAAAAPTWTWPTAPPGPPASRPRRHGRFATSGPRWPKLRTRGVKAEDFDTRGQRPKSWRTRPGWTRKAARARLDIAVEERECYSRTGGGTGVRVGQHACHDRCQGSWPGQGVL
jgi:pimeloyl-ACP methyl ester carboxylesterase